MIAIADDASRDIEDRLPKAPICVCAGPSVRLGRLLRPVCWGVLVRAHAGLSRRRRVTGLIAGMVGETDFPKAVARIWRINHPIPDVLRMLAVHTATRPTSGAGGEWTRAMAESLGKRLIQRES